jgi:hypothetical protein
MLSKTIANFVYRTVIGASIGAGIGAFSATLTPSVSNAAPIELLIATEYVTDAETGLKTPAALNASGKADLSYMNNGIVLTYEGNDGKSHKVKIHLDFDSLLNADLSNRAAAIATFDAINKQGPSLIGKIISTIAARAKASGQNLALMLDSHRSPGFTKTDFDLGQVRLVTSGGENVRLQNLVASNFIPKQTQVTSQQENVGQDPAPMKTCEGTFIE